VTKGPLPAPLYPAEFIPIFPAVCSARTPWPRHRLLGSDSTGESLRPSPTRLSRVTGESQRVKVGRHLHLPAVSARLSSVMNTCQMPLEAIIMRE
jgi:hypothetical protein